MATIEEVDGGVAQFAWGKKKGVGAKKGIQFYESFTYDDIEYSLYDCVYLYKDGEPLPYIGKLVKIWEQPVNKRRVKVLWFFRPSEILTYLGDESLLKNEIFLASGEGQGLFNVNPLEAIGGKCSVVCTSKDQRNRQPTQDELKMADFIFYRTFNVGSYKISDKIEDVIAGVEAKLILNSKEPNPLVFAASGKAGGSDEHDKTDEGETTANSGSASLAEEKCQSTKAPSPSEGPEDRPSKKVKLEFEDNLSKRDILEVEDEPSKKDKLEVEEKPPKKDKLEVEDKCTKKDNLEADFRKIRAEPKCDSDSGKTATDVNRTSDDSRTKLSKESRAVEKVSSDNTKFKDKKSKLSNGAMVKVETVEVTKKPEIDRSKWFADLPWDTRIKNAYEQDRLVMLDNLDPDYSHAEVEEMINLAFNQSCSVRLIEQSAYTNPNHGQALVIFKSSDAADLVVQKLDTDILMLPNGRPLLASKGIARSPDNKSSALIGHLSIDKFTKLKKQREEMRKAASSSHFSQGNTIQFEMAIEWMFLDARSRSWWQELHETNRREVKKITASLKTK